MVRLLLVLILVLDLGLELVPGLSLGLGLALGLSLVLGVGLGLEPGYFPTSNRKTKTKNTQGRTVLNTVSARTKVLKSWKLHL